MTRRLQIRGVKGPDAGLVLRYPHAAMVVFGRGGDPDEAGELPKDAALSREHARARWSEDGLVLEALEGRSLSQTGRKTRAILVGDEALVEMGRSTYLFTTLDGDDASLPVRRWEEFVILEEIARGATGAVVRARDQAGGGELCLKTIHPSLMRERQVLKYFDREVAVLAGLSHPGVVRVLCHGRQPGFVFLGMDWIDGSNLEEHVRVHGPRPEAEVRGLAHQLLEALEAVHAAGIVHRDVKPANVLLHHTWPRTRLTLCDFGLARRLDGALETLTRTGEFRGSLAYAPLEMLHDARHATPQADVYGAAATLFFAATGCNHFERSGDGHEVVARLGGAERLTISGLRPEWADPRLASVIDRGLSPGRDARWASAAAMNQAIG